MTYTNPLFGEMLGKSLLSTNNWFKEHLEDWQDQLQTEQSEHLLLQKIFLLFKNIIFIYLLIFSYAGSSLLCRLFSSCREQGPLSSRSVGASHCGGFSCCGAQALGLAGFSSCSSQAPEHRLNSFGIQPQLLCGMWDLPRPGIELMFPALAGRFFTTETPEKPENIPSW